MAFNRRRLLLGVFAASVVAVTVPSMNLARAQKNAKIFRVGMLSNWGPGPVFETLKSDLARLGYVEGKTIVFEARFPEGQLERLPGFAAELAGLGVDVIATYGGPPTNAARKASSTIPIVAAIVADPVAVGFAATLERPGGNITGITSNDPSLGSQQWAIFKQLVPKLARVAILSDSDIPGADSSGLAPIERANVAAAGAAGLKAQVLKVRGPAPDLDAAFKAMASEGAQALVILEVPVTIPLRKRIAELAATHRIPTMFWGGASDAGGVFAYGTSFTDTFAGVPAAIDKILKGAKPAEMPFELVTRREFVINLATTRALGLTMPADLLKRADRVIE